MRDDIAQLTQSRNLKAEEIIRIDEYIVLNNARIKSLLGVEVLPPALIQPKSRVLFLFLQGLTAIASKSKKKRPKISIFSRNIIYIEVYCEDRTNDCFHNEST